MKFTGSGQLTNCRLATPAFLLGRRPCHPPISSRQRASPGDERSASRRRRLPTDGAGYKICYSYNKNCTRPRAFSIRPKALSGGQRPAFSVGIRPPPVKLTPCERRFIRGVLTL